MSRQIEDRLREAYQARAEQLTERRLDQLAADREQGVDALLHGPLPGDPAPIELPAATVPPAGHRRQRWLAPVIAAAVVAALTAGGLSLAGRHQQHAGPVAPASSPASSPAPSQSAASSTASAAPSASSSPTKVAPPYLPAGQTGSRDQVPWSRVGAGWQLLQTLPASSTLPYSRSLYLYDPAGGRYRITDALPAGAHLVGWSPDGGRAMVEVRQGAPEALYQVDLRSGSAVLVLRSSVQASFVTYTRPNGEAFLVGTATDLRRYAADGTLQLTYPRTVNGIDLSTTGAIYSADGSELVRTNDRDGTPVLVGNDGHVIRTFPVPAGFAGCGPVKLWPDGRLLERCRRPETPQSGEALVLQPLSGAGSQVLANAPTGTNEAYWDAWPISNGDVLLENWGDCGGSTYDILDGSTGVIRPLRWPGGVPPLSEVSGVSGDVAMFAHRTPSGCGNGTYQYETYSYQLLTGQVTKLIDGQVAAQPWPGS
ncbi:MAG TPA: hypothetical protein VMB79_12400 [Jatrophihabitans sp.]|nr:hypothetical protein [Jatrophihabitans sp.]